MRIDQRQSITAQADEHRVVIAQFEDALVELTQPDHLNDIIVGIRVIFINRVLPAAAECVRKYIPTGAAVKFIRARASVDYPAARAHRDIVVDRVAVYVEGVGPFGRVDRCQSRAESGCVEIGLRKKVVDRNASSISRDGQARSVERDIRAQIVLSVIEIEFIEIVDDGQSVDAQVDPKNVVSVGDKRCVVQSPVDGVDMNDVALIVIEKSIRTRTDGVDENVVAGSAKNRIVARSADSRAAARAHRDGVWVVVADDIELIGMVPSVDGSDVGIRVGVEGIIVAVVIGGQGDVLPIERKDQPVRLEGIFLRIIVSAVIYVDIAVGAREGQSIVVESEQDGAVAEVEEIAFCEFRCPADQLNFVVIAVEIKNGVETGADGMHKGIAIVAGVELIFAVAAVESAAVSSDGYIVVE